MGMGHVATDTDVLVVRAGPVGLFLANECARHIARGGGSSRRARLSRSIRRHWQSFVPQRGRERALQMVEMFSIEHPKPLVTEICSEPKRRFELESAVITTEGNGIDLRAVNALRLRFALRPTGRHGRDPNISNTAPTKG
jgi:hypothetical protein